MESVSSEMSLSRYTNQEQEQQAWEPAKQSDDDSYLAALTQLISTYKEDIGSDQSCSSCNMSTRNLQKHLDIKKCKMMPFPESEKKKRRDKLRIK